MNITVVILTKNEEKNIIDCIQSVSFCNEILVVDDNSTDRTVELVKKIEHRDCKVILHSLENFSAQRNFALSKATHEWVLFVDADERVSVELSKEIQRHINHSTHDAYSIRRVDYLWGKKLQYGESGNISFVRLAKKSAGTWIGNVHEVWEVKENIQKLSHPLIHMPHETLREFIAKINTYSSIRAEELHHKKVSSNVLAIFAYPKAKFIKNYIFLRGFKDGNVGFVHALMMSLHSFLVRAKLYLLWKGIKNI